MYLGLGSHQRQQVNLYDILGVSLPQCLSPKCPCITLFGLKATLKHSFW